MKDDSVVKRLYKSRVYHAWHTFPDYRELSDMYDRNFAGK